MAILIANHMWNTNLQLFGYRLNWKLIMLEMTECLSHVTGSNLRLLIINSLAIIIVLDSVHIQELRVK